MATRYRKIRKKRGTRTCGGGSHKKRRGKGNRGGSGKAGGCKHKWSWIVKYAPNHFGRRGFKIPKAVKKEYEIINVGEIEENLEKFLKNGIANEKKGKIVVNLSGYKVLGEGKITKPLIIKALAFSSSALEKIRNAGGEAIEG